MCYPGMNQAQDRLSGHKWLAPKCTCFDRCLRIACRTTRIIEEMETFEEGGEYVGEASG